MPDDHDNKMNTDPERSKPSPRRRVVPARRRWLAALALLGLTSCGVFTPVPEMAPNALSPWLPPEVAGSSDPAASAAQAGTCRSAPPHLDFAGGLGQAICELDARRLSYLRLSANELNTTSTYNAMLWPLAGGMLYELLRGAPNSNLLLPSVVAATSYGMMNSGIPGRQQIYLAASRQLACAIVASGADLYPATEVRVEAKAWAPPPRPAPLAAAVVALRSQIDVYESERARLLADAMPRPGTRAEPVDSYSAARNRFSGAAAGGSKGGDSRPMLSDQTRVRLTEARKHLVEGQALLRWLDGRAAAALRGEGARIDAALHEQLAAKAPPLAVPASVTASLADLQKGMLKLQSGAEGGGEGAIDPSEAALPSAVFDGLSDPTRKALRTFQSEQGIPLRRATQDVADWIARHKTGQAEVKALLAQIGCNPAAPPAAALPAPASSRPTTSNSGGAANVPSQSRLSP